MCSGLCGPSATSASSAAARGAWCTLTHCRCVGRVLMHTSTHVLIQRRHALQLLPNTLGQLLTVLLFQMPVISVFLGSEACAHWHGRFTSSSADVDVFRFWWCIDGFHSTAGLN